MVDADHLYLQLSYLFEEDMDRALSKDVDVALWQDYRTHRNMQPVRDELDFVIVNDKLHDEFDEFKRAEIESIYSYLRLNELLKLYLRCHPHLSGFAIKKCGHTYLRLLSERVNHLCQWIYELRESFHTDIPPVPPPMLTYLQVILLPVLAELWRVPVETATD